MASVCASTWSTPTSSVAAPAKPNRTQLRVGRLVKAHGLKGALKVELYTDDPARRFTPGATFTLQVPTTSEWHGKSLELVELRWYNTHAVAFFKDVPDRTVAETLVKAILWVEQETEELPVEEDAWYDHQLVGLAVLRDGVRVGTVSQIDHLPAQDLLTVATETGDVLVPFVKEIVPAVDIAAGTLTVTPPPGLFEQLPDDDDTDDDDQDDAPAAGDSGTPASESE
jgi:16S rRNA processing protein RimM